MDRLALKPGVQYIRKRKGMKYEKGGNLPEYRVEEIDTTESAFVESVSYALSRGFLPVFIQVPVTIGYTVFP